MRKSEYDLLLARSSLELRLKLFPNSEDWQNRYCPVDIDPPTIGLVLGTGWGDTVKLDEASASVPLADLPGFETLEEVPNHARRITVGTLGGKRVVVLSGRVHANETTFNPEHGNAMLRMQIELMFRLGVKTLVLTAAVGGLSILPRVGHVAVIDSLVTDFAGPMPMFPGEFKSPEDKLDAELIGLATRHDKPELRVTAATHCFVRGPWFESRKRDKRILRMAAQELNKNGILMRDNSVVGMSMLPELCIAALYDDVRALALGYVTNGPIEEHSHEGNVAAARSKAELLGDLLRNIVKDI